MFLTILDYLLWESPGSLEHVSLKAGHTSRFLIYNIFWVQSISLSKIVPIWAPFRTNQQTHKQSLLSGPQPPSCVGGLFLNQNPCLLQFSRFPCSQLSYPHPKGGVGDNPALAPSSPLRKRLCNEAAQLFWRALTKGNWKGASGLLSTSLTLFAGSIYHTPVDVSGILDPAIS